MKLSLKVIPGVVLGLMLSLPCPAHAGRYKTIFIMSFNKIEGISPADPIGNDIKDFISEIFVDSGRYSLMSMDEAKEVIEQTEKLQACTTDACMKDLIRSIKTDCLLYGNVMKVKGRYMVYAKMLERVRGRSVVRMRRGRQVVFPDRRYIERASHTLARAMLIRDTDKSSEIISDFKDFVAQEEERLSRAEKKREKMVTDTDRWCENYRSEQKRSPLVRAGYGGFGLVRFHDTRLDSYYDGGGQSVFMDFFFRRARDIDGDGVDLYFRGSWKFFTMTDAGLGRVAEDFISGEPFEKRPGYYHAVPDSPATMDLFSMSAWVRFVTSFHFIGEIWSLYLPLGIRCSYLKEEYTAAGSDFSKTFIGLGGCAGAGLEISLFPHIGIFAEGIYGFTPAGDSSANIDGLQVLYGITLRTGRWRGHNEY